MSGMLADVRPLAVVFALTGLGLLACACSSERSASTPEKRESVTTVRPVATATPPDPVLEVGPVATATPQDPEPEARPHTPTTPEASRADVFAPVPSASTSHTPEPPDAATVGTESLTSDQHLAKGDYYFRAGYYLKAAESYREAVLSDIENPWKKLAFGQALMAIGNYAYSSYALRRGISQVGSATAFTVDVASLFPSPKAFAKSVKDLKRYVTYSPRDPAGLTVLGYFLYSADEDDRAREVLGFLKRLPKNDKDPFADFFLDQLDRRREKKAQGTPGK